MDRITYILRATDRSSEEKDGLEYNYLTFTAERPDGKVVGTYKVSREECDYWRYVDEKGMPWEHLPETDDSVMDELWEAGVATSEKKAPQPCAVIYAEDEAAVLSVLECPWDKDGALRGAWRYVKRPLDLPDAVNLVNAMMAVLDDTDDDQMELTSYEDDETEEMTLALTASGPLAESALGLLDSLTETRPVNRDYEDGVYYRSYAGQ